MPATFEDMLLSQLSKLFDKDEESGGIGPLCVCTRFTSFLVGDILSAHHYLATQPMNESYFLMNQEALSLAH